MALLGTALLTCGGCTTPPSKQEMVAYFDTPARSQFTRPVYVSVVDERPEEERRGTGWSHRYLSTTDGPSPERVAFVFAEDLASLLLRKEIADSAVVSRTVAEAPQDSTILSVKLLSWYGRVVDFDKLTKTERLTMGLGSTSPAYDNKGRCQFSAVLIQPEMRTDLGTFTGEFVAMLKAGGSLREANALSAGAADRAFMEFLIKLEKVLLATVQNIE